MHRVDEEPLRWERRFEGVQDVPHALAFGTKRLRQLGGHRNGVLIFTASPHSFQCSDDHTRQRSRLALHRMG